MSLGKYIIGTHSPLLTRDRFYQKQTRSADEPMTVFITCKNCGNEWRDGG